MYSSDSESLSDDGERLAPRNTKTTPAPPPVYSFEQLQAFKDDLESKQAIVCAVDFETVDNHSGTDLEKMSEIGVAIYDPRSSPLPSKATSNASRSNAILEDLGKVTTAHHVLVDKWKRVTEITCAAFWHRNRKNKPGRPHKARPYHCQFARSIILGRDESINWLKALLHRLATQNLTAEETEKGDQREIRLLFWDSGLEDRIFRQASIHLPELGKGIQAWDLQAWWPFRVRFNDGINNGQANGETAFASLGVLGMTSTTVLHNATNDSVAQLLAFLRMTVMTEAEWKAWYDENVNFAPISFDWLDKTIYEDNISQSPGYQRSPQSRKPKHGNKVQGRRYGPQSSNGKKPFSTHNQHNGTPAPSNAPTTSNSNSQNPQSCQRVTGMEPTQVHESTNTAGSSTKIANLTQGLNNVHLEAGDAQIAGLGKEDSQEPEGQEAQGVGKRGGRSRKQRSRKSKAAKREKCSRHIPGLS